MRRHFLLCLLISVIFIFTGCTSSSSSEESKVDSADLEKKHFRWWDWQGKAAIQGVSVPKGAAASFPV